MEQSDYLSLSLLLAHARSHTHTHKDIPNGQEMGGMDVPGSYPMTHTLSFSLSCTEIAHSNTNTHTHSLFPALHVSLNLILKIVSLHFNFNSINTVFISKVLPE